MRTVYFPLVELADERAVSVARIRQLCATLRLKVHPEWGLSAAQVRRLDAYIYRHTGILAGKPLPASWNG